MTPHMLVLFLLHDLLLDLDANAWRSLITSGWSSTDDPTSHTMSKGLRGSPLPDVSQSFTTVSTIGCSVNSPHNLTCGGQNINHVTSQDVFPQNVSGFWFWYKKTVIPTLVLVQKDSNDVVRNSKGRGRTQTSSVETTTHVVDTNENWHTWCDKGGGHTTSNMSLNFMFLYDCSPIFWKK